MSFDKDYLQCPGCGINIHWEILATDYKVAKQFHDIEHEKMFRGEIKYETFKFLEIEDEDTI